MMTASTSIAAYRSIDLTEMEQKVLDVISASGVRGCISDEVRAVYPSLSYSTVTARFSSLKSKKCIYLAGDTRPGISGRQQKVMRLVEHSAAVPETIPEFPKGKRNPFLAGMIFATKVVMKETDLSAAKLALREELIKASAKRA